MCVGMHPRNRYNVKPDFGELASFHPPLEQYLIRKKSKSGTNAEESAPPKEGGISSGKSPTIEKQFPYMLDFSNPLALRELTLAVMAKDFGLDVVLPVDKLIPAVPQRLNYVHWVEDLLSLCESGNGTKTNTGNGTKTNAGNGMKTNTENGTEIQCGGGNGMETNCEDENRMETVSGSATIGIDIGTGASCIYPLLGTRLNDWSFIATDIDKESISVAKENISRNGLDDKIKVIQVPPEVVLKEVLDPTVSRYAFCMCNPPFFKDTEERLGGVASQSGRRPAARTFSNATTNEATTHGGEREFVSRIIEDSLQLGTRVGWYTAMLGKKASLKPLKELLKQNNVPVITTTEFVQGKTWRWGLAWSFELSLKEKVDALNALPKDRKRKRSLTLQLPVHQLLTSAPPTSRDRVQLVREWLLRQLEELEITVTEAKDVDPTVAVLLHCEASKNTWSHQRRRKRITDHLERHIREAAVARATKTDETVKRDESIEALKQKAKTGLESLSTPCNMKFKCSVVLANVDSEVEPSLSKKQKPSPGQSCKVATPSMAADGSVGGGTELCVELNWVEGVDRDSLHQILQYLANKL